MRRMLIIAVLCALPLLTGCALNDFIFGLFSDSYSAGGDSYQEKQNHYDSQIEAARAGYDR
jgi:major membrane immunogen (membrane-anchored lipoprotein)